jgi:hypothetical protein
LKLKLNCWKVKTGCLKTANRVPSPTQRPCCIMHHAVQSQDSEFEWGFCNWLFASWLQNPEFSSKLRLFSELRKQTGND